MRVVELKVPVKGDSFQKMLLQSDVVFDSESNGWYNNGNFQLSTATWWRYKYFYFLSQMTSRVDVSVFFLDFLAPMQAYKFYTIYFFSFSVLFVV